MGFFGGYYLDHSRGFGILIWAIACAVIVSGMVYCLRVFVNAFVVGAIL